MQINTDYIKAQLQRRATERQLSKVASGCGVNVRTLQRIAKGESCSMKIAGKVQQFLLDTEREKKLSDSE